MGVQRAVSRRPGVTSAALVVLAVVCLVVGACSPSAPPGFVLVPERAAAPPGPAAFRPLPQIAYRGGTYCLWPPESGVRVFVNGDPGYNSFAMSMLDVRGRPHGDPWACT